MIFLDTSVLIPAARHSHEHHARSLPLVFAAHPRDTSTGAHALAELYSNLSGAFDPRPSSPRIIRPLIEEYSKRFQVVSLETAESLQVLDECARNSVTGAAVYDALLIACARKVQAEQIYTFNTRDFHRIAPDLASILREP